MIKSFSPRRLGNLTLSSLTIVWIVADILSAGPYCSAAHSVGEQVFTPRHVAQLRSVLSAEISPDGQKVAYTLSVPRHPLQDENGPAWVELHVVDAAGHSRPFVTGHVNVSHVHWLPDAGSIAFIAKRNTDVYSSLYAIPIDGGEAQRWLHHDADLQAVSFSPDGKRVAFLAAEPLSKEQKEYREEGFNQEVFEEDGRPTQVWIAAVKPTGKPRKLELPGSASDVDWSPSGHQLAVVLAPTPSVDDSYMFKRVSVVDVDTGKIVERIQNPGKLGRLAWSPDGKHLAMISGADIHDPADGRLMVAETPGDGSLQDLLPEDKTHVESFAWKDAQTLVWVADEGTASIVGEVGLDGTRRVIRGPGSPIFTNLSLSHDGARLAFVGHKASHPPEVLFQRPDDRSLRRLTHTNPWLKDLPLAKQEVVKWKARDGLSLEGVLVYPRNYEPGRRYPLILYVHGGPESSVSNGWITSYSSPGQVAAARGFAVFCPNYRGSTGRGVEFSKLGQGDAAGREFDDLVDAVDHLVDAGIVDKAKVGITGGSYGGYASAWAATYYSARFAASVMFVGISDNVSKLGTTDIPEEMYLVHHRKRLWEDWQYFAQRSPIHYVQRHHTPLLILHGKEDSRVDPSQSRELYRHLKTLGQAPVRLVLYPGEGHGNRRAAARFDYQLRSLQWMEHYLQGPGGEPPAYAIDYDAAWGEAVSRKVRHTSRTGSPE